MDCKTQDKCVQRPWGDRRGPLASAPPCCPQTPRAPGGTISCNGRRVENIGRGLGAEAWTGGATEPQGQRKGVLKRKKGPMPGLLLPSVPPLNFLWRKKAGPDLLRISYPSLGAPRHRSFKSKIMKHGCWGGRFRDLSVRNKKGKREREREGQRKRERERQREGDREIDTRLCACNNKPLKVHF